MKSASTTMGPGGTGHTKYKRRLDLSILIVAHIVLAPVWLLLWIAIPFLIWFEDRGPIFYRQSRMGRGGQPFTLLKFRTMVVGADRIGPRWNINGDPRVTRVGRILRRTALDELPGLVAIWKGDMSLVGPRALDAREHVMLESQIPGFARRLQVPPGLTGLSQVYNPKDKARMKLRYDLLYVEKMNLVLDVKLIVLSVINTLAARWDRRDGKPPAPTMADFTSTIPTKALHNGTLTKHSVLAEETSSAGAGKPA